MWCDALYFKKNSLVIFFPSLALYDKQVTLIKKYQCSHQPNQYVIQQNITFAFASGKLRRGHFFFSLHGLHAFIILKDALYHNPKGWRICVCLQTLRAKKASGGYDGLKHCVGPLFGLQIRLKIDMDIKNLSFLFYFP